MAKAPMKDVAVALVILALTACSSSSPAPAPGNDAGAVDAALGPDGTTPDAKAPVDAPLDAVMYPIDKTCGLYPTYAECVACCMSGPNTFGCELEECDAKLDGGPLDGGAE